MKKTKFALIALCAMGLLATPVAAEQADEASDESIFVFGGPLTAGYFSDAIQPWRWELESNVFVGAGYQRFIYGYQSFQLGLEAGLGLRLGTPSSAEAWAGFVGRLTEIELGDMNIVPSVTFGLSAVTDTIGVETERTAAAGQSAAILYYLAPEIAVSHDDHPQWEAFGRLQHRSGGFGTIANIDGTNALTVGLRYKF
ncbi:hypothetical protein SAMN06295905_3651 [Devosia lucknowensis]|uniref:Outer membrane protein beta-barrel domain-containing protein n=1 Tax=Devosia lucknowensis TaxID=1096929 RepID=A0A1Y6GCZ6_9HYPH|nr:hypothetical protein [Devosia lucknowensis]SMQ86347.1 hypothetical protein SAMN06295905_3651 [Devosia lucknowensis]